MRFNRKNMYFGIKKILFSKMLGPAQQDKQDIWLGHCVCICVFIINRSTNGFILNREQDVKKGQTLFGDVSCELETWMEVVGK